MRKLLRESGYASRRDGKHWNLRKDLKRLYTSGCPWVDPSLRDYSPIQIDFDLQTFQWIANSVNQENRLLAIIEPKLLLEDLITERIVDE